METIMHTRTLLFTILALVVSLPLAFATRAAGCGPHHDDEGVICRGFLAAADHSGHGGHGASKAATTTENRIYTTTGVFENAEADGKATITHEPVPALGWPKMTMRFRPEAPALLEGLKKGDKVRLDFKPQMDGTPLILHIEPAQ